MKAFMLCFVPLFVAIDPIGVLPIYLGLTSGLSRSAVSRVLWQSILTAGVVALAFLFVGEGLFQLLDITSADFMVAGGVLLFVLSLADLVAGDAARRRLKPQELGVVPLGVPILVGPAVLTTLLLLAHQHGRALTASVTVLNIAVVGLLLRYARPIDRLLGPAGMRALSKLASLILAAIAVKMIRQGLLILIG